MTMAEATRRRRGQAAGDVLLDCELDHLPPEARWRRLRDQGSAEPANEAHLLALVDAWPPAVLPHLSAPAPGSSLTWTIEFVQPMSELSTLDWCLYRAQIEHARDGYGHVAAALWSPAGELLAISRQTVAVFG